MFPTLYKPLKYYLQKFCKRFRRCKLYNILEKTLKEDTKYQQMLVAGKPRVLFLEHVTQDVADLVQKLG